MRQLRKKILYLTVFNGLFYGQLLFVCIAFDREQFDRLEYSAAELEKIFDSQDTAMKKRIHSTVIDVFYTRHLCRLLGINYAAPTTEDNVKVYKYAMCKYHLLKYKE